MAEHGHLVALQVVDKLITAPTEIWLGVILNVLHPQQKEDVRDSMLHIIEEMKKPKVYVPSNGMVKQ